MKKILLFLLLTLTLTGCSRLGSFSFSGPPSPFYSESGIITPMTATDDFMVGSVSATTTADLYCDVSKNICFMPSVSIGSMSLTSEILTPMTLRYAIGSATSSDFTIDKDGDLHITSASSTYPNQFIVANDGNVSVSGIYKFDSEYDNGNSGTTKTISFANGGRQKMAMTGNCVITLTPPNEPSTMILKITQGASDYTVNFATSSNAVYFYDGAAPDLSSTAGEVDLISIYFDGSAFWGVASLKLKAL